MEFRTIPVVIEAVQITDRWFDDDHPNPLHPLGVIVDPIGRECRFKAAHGIVTGFVGDWIITAEDKRFLCKSDIFKQTYEPVEE